MLFPFIRWISALVGSVILLCSVCGLLTHGTFLLGTVRNTYLPWCRVSDFISCTITVHIFDLQVSGHQFVTVLTVVMYYQVFYLFIISPSPYMTLTVCDIVFVCLSFLMEDQTVNYSVTTKHRSWHSTACSHWLMGSSNTQHSAFSPTQTTVR